MDINDANLSFHGSLSRRSATRRIILHHAEASTCSPQQVHKWHLNNGWSGAGYHFLVRKDGSVYSLRPEWAVGAHASGSNGDSIGICFEGNFMRETMGQAQIEAGRQLVAHLKSKYGIQTVQRHKDVCSTDCPGTSFPFDAIVNGSVVSSFPATSPSAPAASKPAATTSGFGGTYRVNASKLNIRTKPSLSGSVVASYSKGQTVVLDDWYTKADGYIWGRYTGYSGNVRYIAVGKATGKPEPDDYLIKIG